MIPTNLISGTQEWLLARARCITASEDAAKLCAPKGIGKAGQDVINSVVAHHFVDHVEPSYTSFAMQRGIELQTVAEGFLMQSFPNHVKKKLDFAYLDSTKLVGCSFDLFLDPIVSTEKYIHIEIKCPESVLNHYEFLEMKSAADLKEVNSKYYWQCLHQIHVIETDNTEFYFSSFHPNFKEGNQLTLLKLDFSDPFVESDLLILSQRLKMAGDIIAQKLKAHEL
jgi:hypothetical protein